MSRCDAMSRCNAIDFWPFGTSKKFHSYTIRLSNFRDITQIQFPNEFHSSFILDGISRLEIDNFQAIELLISLCDRTIAIEIALH